MAGFAGIASTTLAATSSSGRVELPPAVGAGDSGNPERPVVLRGILSARIICTPGTLAASDLVYVTFGDSTVVATPSNGTPIVPGLVELHVLQPGETHMAAICTAATSTVAVTLGLEK